MSGLICAIYRSDRGDRIRRVRLIGRETDESWTPTESEGADPLACAEAAAAWVRGRLQARSMKALASVCVDSDGSVCGWVRPVSTDPGVVEAMVRRSDGEVLLAGAEETYSAGAGEPSLAPGIEQAGAGDVQALVAPTSRTGAARRGAPRRMSVMTLRDACVQLMLSALEDQGVTVERVQSSWHALAEAWVGSGDSPERAAEESVVAEQRALTCVVLVDRAGRLTWAWADDAGLLAGGSSLLVTHREEPVCRPSDAGRLASDWLAWGAQLGTGPTRILLIAPETLGEEEGLTAQAFGEELARLWPSATVDAARYEDPMRQTLARLVDDPAPASREAEIDPATRSTRRSMALGATLVAVASGGVGAWLVQRSIAAAEIAQREFGILAGGLLIAAALLAAWEAVQWGRLARRPREREALSSDPRHSIVGLSRRPGRAHRAAYRWGGIALALAGVLAGAFGWRINARAEQAAAIAADFEAGANELYRDQGLEPASGGRAVLNMESHLASERQKHAAPSDLPQPRPILSTLDSLLLVLGTNQPERVELRRIHLDNFQVRLEADVPTLQLYVQLRENLRAVDSPLRNWNAEQSDRAGSDGQRVMRAIYTASWDETHTGG